MTKEVRSVQPPPFANLAWSEEQRTIIGAAKNARLLVEAGPGTGKTAVACARVAHLIATREASAAKILVVSFTRTAVREVRDRIFAFAQESPEIARVKITTIDSHSWGLRNGFEEETDTAVLRSVDYHTNLERLCALLDARSEGLHDFLSELDHVIIDEAQDVVGVRARMLSSLAGALSSDCGITVFLDPAQAIYGFTSDRDDGSSGGDLSFAAHARANPALRFVNAKLTTLFRTGDTTVKKVFEATRELVVPESSSGVMAYQLVREEIVRLAKAETADMNALDLDGRHDALVLFRTRAEVLQCSSWMSSKPIEHRLRLSGLPTVVRPWIGRLLSHCTEALLARATFDALWAERVGELFLGQPSRDQAWSQIRRLGGDSSGRVELKRLRRVLARSRPPIEICSSELGYSGPILGTIHASKGREAELVRLVVPTSSGKRERSDAEWHEEARVLYVGATRAKANLEVIEGRASYVGYLDSGRAYRSTTRKGASGAPSAQIQFGLLGDVDYEAQLSGEDAVACQQVLAGLSGRTHPVSASAIPADGFRYRVELPDGRASTLRVGFLSQSVNNDLFLLAKRATKGRSQLRPSMRINHLYVAAVTTVSIGEEIDIVLPQPFATSRIFLAPVIRGFSTVYFSPYRSRS